MFKACYLPSLSLAAFNISLILDTGYCSKVNYRSTSIYVLSLHPVMTRGKWKSWERIISPNLNETFILGFYGKFGLTVWLLSEVIKYIKVSSCQGHVKFWILVSALTTGTSTKLSAGEEALMEQLCTKSAALSPRDEKVCLGGSAPAFLRPGEDRTKSTPWTQKTTASFQVRSSKSIKIKGCAFCSAQPFETRFDKALILILCWNSLANHPCSIASSRSVQSVLQVRLQFLDTPMSLTKPARQAPVSDWKHEVKIGHCPVQCLPCAAPWLMNVKDAPNSSKDQQIAQIQGCLLSLGIWKSMIQTEELTEIIVLGDFPWTKAIPNRSKWAFGFNFRVGGSFEHHNQTADGYQNELCEWLCILIIWYWCESFMLSCSFASLWLMVKLRPQQVPRNSQHSIEVCIRYDPGNSEMLQTAAEILTWNFNGLRKPFAPRPAHGPLMVLPSPVLLLRRNYCTWYEIAEVPSHDRKWKKRISKRIQKKIHPKR